MNRPNRRTIEVTLHDRNLLQGSRDMVQAMAMFLRNEGQWNWDLQSQLDADTVALNTGVEGETDPEGHTDIVDQWIARCESRGYHAEVDGFNGHFMVTNQPPMSVVQYVLTDYNETIKTPLTGTDEAIFIAGADAMLALVEKKLEEINDHRDFEGWRNW